MKPEDRDYVLDKVREMETDKRRFIEATAIPFPKIEIPSFRLPDIDFSLFQLKINIPHLAAQLNQYAILKMPKITFSKIEIPEINYERIKTITNNNSKYGWTLTGEMGIRDYLEDNMVGASQEEKDEYFYHYYSNNDWENFGYTKSTILDEIEPRWRDLIQECFDSFEDDKHRLVIPTLFTNIEGEISYVFQSHQGSYDLIQLMEKKAKNEEAEMKQIALYSVVHSMQDQLFGSHKFYKERNQLINRHWILHGRDKPSQWQKVDALRLFKVISSL